MWQVILGVLAVLTAASAGPAAGGGAARKPAEPPEFRIALYLTDGSRLIAAPAGDRLDVHTDHGDIEIRWEHIRIIEWKADDPGTAQAAGVAGRAARIDLANGDHVAGRLPTEKLEFKAVFGPVTIPLVCVRRVAAVGAVAAASALLFDGKQNFVTVPNDPALDPTQAMTLECWFKTTATHPFAILGKRQWVPEQWPGPDDHGYQIHFSGGQLIAYWEGISLFGRPAADGQWHHAAMTWDGKNRRLFLDGTKVAQDNPGVWKPADVPFRIGGVDGSRPQANFFDGAISQVRLSKVDRYAGRNFTPETCFAVDADTIACWNFDEGFGDLLCDSSGHGHDGKLTGNPPPKWIQDAPTLPADFPGDRDKGRRAPDMFTRNRVLPDAVPVNLAAGRVNRPDFILACDRP